MVKKRIDRDRSSERGLAYLRWRYIDNFQRTLRARTFRTTSADAFARDTVLREEGVLVAPVGELLSEPGRRAFAEASEELSRTCASEEFRSKVRRGASRDRKGYRVRLLPEELSADSPFVRVARDPELLGYVGRYLRMAPFLFDLRAFLNLPTNRGPTDSQLWHRDPEDRQVIKVLVYMNDVDGSNGAFRYIPGSHGLGRFARVSPPHRDHKRVLDHEMEAVFPRGTWKSMTGPAHTAILADTTGFHRGGWLERGSRIVLHLTYTSGKPLVKPPKRFKILDDARA